MFHLAPHACVQARTSRSHPICAPHPHLERGLRCAVMCGLLAVLLFPLARADMPWLGWVPLWLVGMPLVAWWAVHRFRLPAGWVRRAVAGYRRGRRPQAYRTRHRSRPAWTYPTGARLQTNV